MGATIVVVGGTVVVTTGTAAAVGEAVEAVPSPTSAATSQALTARHSITTTTSGARLRAEVLPSSPVPPTPLTSPLTLLPSPDSLKGEPASHETTWAPEPRTSFRTMAATDFERIFHPRRMAIVGVSSEGGYGFANGMLIACRAMGFTGEILPVNPKGGSFAGQTIYRSVDDIPGDIDFAIIAVPAAAVPEALEACRRKGAAGRRGADRRLRGDRHPGGPGPGAAGPGGRRPGDPGGRPQLLRDLLPRLRPHPPARARPLPRERAGGLPVAERRHVHRPGPPGQVAGPALQQGGVLRQRRRPARGRVAPLPGRRPGDRGHRHVRGGSGRRRRVLRRHPGGGAAQAGGGPEGGPVRGRGAGRRWAHRLHGRAAGPSGRGCCAR